MILADMRQKDHARTLLKRLDNREGNISEANDSFLRMVGYSRDELLDGEVNWKEMPPLNMNTLMKKP